MIFSKNEIIAMVVIFEGHLPQGYKIDKRKIADEIIFTAHQQGLPGYYKLSQKAAIRVQRADEKAFYMGDYKPTDDIPPLLQECIKEVRDTIVENGEIPGPMPLKMMQFKTKSRDLSVVWVGIQVKIR